MREEDEEEAAAEEEEEEEECNDMTIFVRCSVAFYVYRWSQLAIKNSVIQCVN